MTMVAVFQRPATDDVSVEVEVEDIVFDFDCVEDATTGVTVATVGERFGGMRVFQPAGSSEWFDRVTVVSKRPPAREDGDRRFYTQDLEESNVADMLLNVAASLDQSLMAGLAPIKADFPLVGIVDEDDGGIIAYAIGEANGQRVVVALEDIEGPKGVNG